jgi:putative ABC transport system ATP-binding protein
MSSKQLSQSMNGQPLIQLQGIAKTYINAAGSFPALKNINLDFYQGEFVGVIGKSGSGKSTLVNMITGIDRPTEGRVLIEGADIHKMKKSKQARWRGLNLGVVFQFFQLLPMLTLLENVLLPMDFCKKYEESERISLGMELLSTMGLADEANALPGAVSGGQQQSAAIARALANDPPIIVADEPTGNLDARTADSVYDKFQSLAETGRTIIMITHDPELEDRLSRTILISDGEVIDPLVARAFHWMPHPLLRACTNSLIRRTYAADQPLGIDTDLADSLIILESGRLKAIEKSEKGLRVSRILQPGDFFAGHRIIGNTASKPAAIITEKIPSQVIIIPFKAFLEAASSYPDIQQRLQGYLDNKTKTQNSEKRSPK